MTPSQRALFFSLATQAASLQGIPPSAFETWRHTIIAQACPESLGSLRNINSATQADALLQAISRLAQNYTLSHTFIHARARRLATMVEASINQIWSLHQICTTSQKKYPHPAKNAIDYAAAIARQAAFHIDGHIAGKQWWLSLSENQLLTLFQITDSHRRRLLTQASKYYPLLLPSGAKAHRQFKPQAHYTLGIAQNGTKGIILTL